jgi:hypothetical protein
LAGFGTEADSDAAGDADAYAARAGAVVRAVADAFRGALRRTLLASADVPA